MSETRSNAQPKRSTVIFKFVTATVMGAVFFLVPVRVGGQWTIPFDVVVSYLTERLPGAVALYSLLAILASVVLNAWCEL